MAVFALPPVVARWAVATRPLDSEVASELVPVHGPEPAALHLLVVRDVVLPRPQFA